MDSTPAPALAPAVDVDPPGGALLPVKRGEIALAVFLTLALFIPTLGNYSLWDPWETHYGEVARRMLQDDDYVVTRWQNEVFRSKPPLTFWMMAVSLRAFGVASDGGYSGELVSSPYTEFALRLPFALTGVFGVLAIWYLIRRMHSRRAAWIAAAAVATCPYYFFVTRQAITDMPMCMMLIVAAVLFAFAFLGPAERSPGVIFKRFTSAHAFFVVFALSNLLQIGHFAVNLYATRARFRLSPTFSLPGWVIMLVFGAAAVGILVWMWFATRTRRQVYLYWMYWILGISCLAKGPVAIAVLGLAAVAYMLILREWRILRDGELIRGLIILLVMALPWHFAMYMRDGQAWVHEYIGQHLFGRAGPGVFGDRGTYVYYFSQLGVGMWPWIALLPAGMAAIFVARSFSTRRERLRLLVGCWGILAFAFFGIITTKFHHYILPAVPALAILVALWLDDVVERPERTSVVLVLFGIGLAALTALDFVNNEDRLVELCIFRYDRPWPGEAPWYIDYSTELWIIALVGCLAIAALTLRAARRPAVFAIVGAAVIFAGFNIHVLHRGASPHWGQQSLHQVYYQKRKIHGIDLVYDGWREPARDFAGNKDFEVRSVIPETMALGDPMTVTYKLPDGKGGSVRGSVSKIDKDDDRFWINVPEGERQAVLAAVGATGQNRPPRPRYLYVNADRLIAWQLNWRGENFYSGGEIWNHKLEDARTVFIPVDNKNFLEYVKPRVGSGRKFFVITEKARLKSLSGVLPSAAAKQSLVEEDNSSNKFALGSFVL